MPKTGWDPKQGILKDVIQWDRDMQCWPTWEEVLEVEYVRCYGNINMFTDDVLSYCRKNGFKHAAVWYERLKKAKVLPTRMYGLAVKFYENDHGPQDSWLPPHVVHQMQDIVQAHHEQCSRMP